MEILCLTFLGIATPVFYRGRTIYIPTSNIHSLLIQSVNIFMDLRLYTKNDSRHQRHSGQAEGNYHLCLIRNYTHAALNI